ncbi:hypothetical protein IFR05_011551 [Cadophora sp. M221]|nr:hypothetical protein IFR05_011551 [Cadophora sp. M221]
MPGKTSKSKPALEMTTSFPQFSNLPLEVRQKIWRETLPGPRVLLIALSKSKPGTCTTKPASYGGRHPALISVDRASRAEGLRFLTPKFNAYWNLEIDTPYFEIKDDADDNVVILAQLRTAGMLDEFKNIAIDWMLWNWHAATQTMEFKYTFGSRFGAYKHPVLALNDLPNIKKCSFIFTDHTLQPDLSTGEAWHLGPSTKATTLSENCEAVKTDMNRQIQRLKAKGLIGEWNPLNVTLREGVDIEVKAIHGRARGWLAPDKLRRETAGWERDWFG